MGRYLQHLLFLLAAAHFVSCQNPVHSRIVGGITGNIADYPWQVALRYNSIPACGGSLITLQWVLTACHCFPPEHDIADYDVVGGTTNLDPPDSGVQVRMIDYTIRHPLYSQNAYSYDTLLVRLKTPFDLSSTVNTIALPAASVQIPAGTSCTVTGWGNVRHSESLASPKPLQVGLVTVISRRTCNCLHHIQPTDDSIVNIQPDMMCAGSVYGSVDACQGDSGGPLSCKVNGIWYQFGVVSWGDVCGSPNRPGVYIATVATVDWIKANVPDAKVQDLTIDTPPTPDDDKGCMAADGNMYPYPSKATTLLITFISLPFYWLTIYLLTNP